MRGGSSPPTGQGLRAKDRQTWHNSGTRDQLIMDEQKEAVCLTYANCPFRHTSVLNSIR